MTSRFIDTARVDTDTGVASSPNGASRSEMFDLVAWLPATFKKASGKGNMYNPKPSLMSSDDKPQNPCRYLSLCVYMYIYTYLCIACWLIVVFECKSSELNCYNLEFRVPKYARKKHQQLTTYFFSVTFTAHWMDVSRFFIEEIHPEEVRKYLAERCWNHAGPLWWKLSRCPHGGAGETYVSWSKEVDGRYTVSIYLRFQNIGRYTSNIF